MPQMMPLLWTILFTFFIGLMISMSCLIFFFHILPSYTAPHSQLMKHKSWTWQW